MLPLMGNSRGGGRWTHKRAAQRTRAQIQEADTCSHLRTFSESPNFSGVQLAIGAVWRLLELQESMMLNV